MIKLTYKRKNRIKFTEKQDSPSVKSEAETLVEPVLSASQVSLSAVASAPSCDGEPAPHLVIKLGIDVHLDRYVVVRQIDGGAPQPPQRFSPTQFLEWAKKQTALARQVYSCYEAGPFGYWLHRKQGAPVRTFRRAAVLHRAGRTSGGEKPSPLHPFRDA